MLASQYAWHRMENGPKAENGLKIGRKKENGPRPEIGKKWPKNGEKIQKSPQIPFFAIWGHFFPCRAVGHFLFFGQNFSHFRLSARFPFYTRRPESQRKAPSTQHPLLGHPSMKLHQVPATQARAQQVTSTVSIRLHNPFLRKPCGSSESFGPFWPDIPKKSDKSLPVLPRQVQKQERVKQGSFFTLPEFDIHMHNAKLVSSDSCINKGFLVGTKQKLNSVIPLAQKEFQKSFADTFRNAIPIKAHKHLFENNL